MIKQKYGAEIVFKDTSYLVLLFLLSTCTLVRSVMKGDTCRLGTSWFLLDLSIFKLDVRYLLEQEGVSAPGRPTCLTLAQW